MASPALLPWVVLPLLPYPLRVRHFLWASLLRLRCQIPRVLVRHFRHSLIFFWAPPQGRVLWWRLNQGVRSFPGTWRFLPKAGPEGQELVARFRLRNL